MNNKQRTYWRKIRNYLFVGLVVSLPAIATIYILQLLFRIIDPVLGRTVSTMISLTPWVDFPIYVEGIGAISYVPGIGLLLTAILLILIGMFTKSIFGKRLLDKMEKLFSKIPIARSIYSTVNQMTNAFIKDRTSFKRVVLVEYPRKGIYTVGFQTGNGSRDAIQKTDKKLINVFLPTTPNPTSGWLVLVPEEEVIFLDMKVEEGLKYVVSGGVVVPPSVHPKNIEQNGNTDKEQLGQVTVKLEGQQ